MTDRQIALKNSIMQIFNVDPYFLDNLNMTEALKKVKESGIKTNFKELSEILNLIVPDEGLQVTESGTSLYINKPEDWEDLGLSGFKQYCFQVF